MSQPTALSGRPARAAGAAPRSVLPLPLALLGELGLVSLLFALWRVIGALTPGQLAAAERRGWALWRAERWLRLPSERGVQHLVLGHPDLVRVLNVFYLAGHLGGLAVAAVWLFVWHRPVYLRWRWEVVAVTAVCLVVQFVAVAPPRLVPATGMVDTAARYHESAYGVLGGVADQLSSMPSVHVAWAILVALAVLRAARTRWRWLVVLHPLATTFAVVATANHYWLDAVAAAGVVGLVLAAGRLAVGRRAAQAAASDRAGRSPVPTSVGSGSPPTAGP